SSDLGLLHDQDQVACQKLTQHRQAHDCPRPRRVIARKGCHELFVTRVLQAFTHGERKQGFSPNILGRVSMNLFVASTSKFAAHVVLPESGLMSTKRTKPRGVAKNH